MSKDKRDYERIELSTTVHIHLEDETVEGELKNLSLGGAFVETDRLMEPSTDIEVSIDNPLTQDLNNLKVKVTRVVDTGVGLKFHKPLFEE